GIGISLVYIFGWRIVFSIGAAAFALALTQGGTFISLLVLPLGDIAEALVGATVLKKILEDRRYFAFQTETVAILAAATVASALNATLNIGTLIFNDEIATKTAFSLWSAWWIAGTLGALIIIPVIFQYCKNTYKADNTRALLISVFLSSSALFIVFLIPHGNAFVFLIFPVLLYAARTAGALPVLIITSLICIISVIATAQGIGPFAYGLMSERFLQIQLFLASVAITGLALASIGSEKLTRLPSVLLLICWFIAGTIFYSFDQSERSKTELAFDTLALKSQGHISDSMKIYEGALRGGVSLYATSHKISADDWKNFLNGLEIDENYPGINGMGVVWPVHNSQLSKLELQMRREGLRDFKISPIPGYSLKYDQAHSPHYILKYTEPRAQNIRVIGMDIGSDPEIRRLVDQSRDTGRPTISNRVSLDTNAKISDGFVLFLPMYKNKAALNTVKERREALKGWVSAAVISESFFGRTLRAASDKIELRVYDGNTIDEKNLMFSNFSNNNHGSNNYNKVIHAKLAQRDLTFIWKSSPKFISSQNIIIAWVGFCGALASLFLTSFLLNIQMVGLRSREMAASLTQELSESREKFIEGERRLLYALDGSDNGIWDWNIERSEMYVSGKLAQSYGWSQLLHAETIDDFTGFVHPEDIEKIKVSLIKHLRGETFSHEVETRYRTKDGNWKWVLTRGQISERNSLGRAVRMTGVHIDINESKLAQKALEKTQSQLRNIANSVPSLISQWDKNMICQFANDAFCKWHGLNPEEVVGMYIHDAVGEEMYAARKEMYAKAARGESLAFESEVKRTLDNSKHYVNVIYKPNVRNGINDGFFLFIQDVTKLKEAELSAVEERRIAVAATSIKSQFLANMSHEIRTPINGIIGMTNLLRSSSLNPEQEEFAEMLSRSSESLLGIINDILDFSKVEAGKLELEIIDFNLMQLLTDTQNSFSISAQQKGIELRLDTTIDAQAMYRGDPGRIQQIFSNLVGNAIKFTHRGHVTVKASIESSDEGGSAFLFEVIDSGVGIPSHALGRMFQAFSQADTTTTRRFGGTGLGLSISKQLVTLMGGDISVDSFEGLGSTFRFRIKLAHGQAIQEIETPITDIKITRNARILVAEDNRINQMIALAILKKLGYSAHAVANGKEVLEAVKESPFDLILMDCQMPDMDGYEATHHIRASLNERNRIIPIIALTANALKGDREKCLVAGMNDYISKPVKEKDLFQVIEKWLVKKQAA
ncbi:MAG: CHASE domain-containing protein, partial [Bdellovibrionota bacterium]